MGDSVLGTAGNGSTLTSSIPVLIGGVDSGGVVRTLVLGSDGSIPVNTTKYAPSYGPTTQFAETCPRWAVSQQVIMVAGTVQLHRITLLPGTYTTISVAVAVAASSPTNVFFGLYNTTTLAKSAACAEASAVLGANTGVVNFTLASSLVNAAVQDYYVAALVGGGTPPTLACHGSNVSTLLSGGYAPTIADRHNTGSLTALPDPVVLANATTAISPSCFYARVT